LHLGSPAKYGFSSVADPSCGYERT